MTIKITIPPLNIKKEPQAKVTLNATKTLDGSLLIDDHQQVDIVIIPKDQRILTMPKPSAEKDTFDYQKALFHSLFKAGVTGNFIEGGTSFGVVEGRYYQSSEVNSLQVVLYEIEKFIKRTQQDEDVALDYDQNIEDHFTDPTPEDSTEYGAIPPYQDTAAGREDRVPSTSYYGYGYSY
jgi:hypothetical protein